MISLSDLFVDKRVPFRCEEASAPLHLDSVSWLPISAVCIKTEKLQMIHSAIPSALVWLPFSATTSRGCE
jgi:hypothetical protein